MTKIVDFDSPNLIASILDATKHGPVVVQFTTVFGLLARGTTAGAAQLDAAKIRAPGKTYGSLMGNPERFTGLAEDLPNRLLTHVRNISECFFRVRIGPTDLQTQTVRQGTHQGLLLPGKYNEVMRALEDATDPDESLYGGKHYTAPIASSWNLSQDPAGSITTRDRALALAKARGIRLVVLGPSAGTVSYPILQLNREHIQVRRRGPGLTAILQELGAPDVG